MKSRPGTSIIEIIIATALISMAIIAALSLTNHSQKQNNYARDLAEASRYASQAADWIRTERDRLGWSQLNTVSAGTYCLNSFPASFLSLVTGTCASSTYISNTMFQRQIAITKNDPIDPTAINIVIEVSWLEEILRQAKIEMELTEW